MIQAVCGQRLQVSGEIEIQVQHGPVMLTGRDKDRRFALPKEVMGIVGVQCDR